MFRLLPLAILTLFLAACSSSTDPDDDGGGFVPSTTFHGYFIDDAVKGLQYQVAGGPIKTTDEFGTFLADAGKEMTFFVDGVLLGTLSQGIVRITPLDFGVTGANIARLLQSLDTTPGVPGIDLAGVDLAGTPIDFTLGSGEFGADPAVQAAVAAAQAVGGSGILVSRVDALAELADGTNMLLSASDLNNVAMFPVSAEDNEPCFVRFRSDGTGQNICQDDIIDDPTGAAVEFGWRIENDMATVEFDFGAGVEERVTIQQLGVTANRISAQVSSERVKNCDPNLEPCIEFEAQTLITALPITAGDFSNMAITFTGPNGSGSATFAANGTGTLTDNEGLENFNWSVGTTLDNVLVLQGSGTAGGTFIYHELILIEGTVANGTFAALFAEATDTNNSGVIDQSEMTSNGVYDAVELLTSN